MAASIWAWRRSDVRAIPRKAGQRTPGLPQSLAPLGRRLGLDEIGQTFHAGQIELAVLKARRVNSPGSARRQPSSP